MGTYYLDALAKRDEAIRQTIEEGIYTQRQVAERHGVSVEIVRRVEVLMMHRERFEELATPLERLIFDELCRRQPQVEGLMPRSQVWVRTLNALRTHGIQSVGDLIDFINSPEFTRTRNFGPACQDLCRTAVLNSQPSEAKAAE